jgi:hypothetical protein
MSRPTTTRTPADPRVAGGRYRGAYWGIDYTVNAIESARNGFLQSITVTDKDGTRTHATAWDARDQILFDPRTERPQP